MYLCPEVAALTKIEENSVMGIVLCGKDTRDLSKAKTERAVKRMVAPFEGIRVVELAQHFAGPVAGRLLADWGAEVIHVEHPIRGDTGVRT